MNGQPKPRRAAPPLDERSLQELALAYVGRFATTRAKLRAYLQRKLRERGWDGAREADLTGLADRFAERGFVDDAGYAIAKAQALASRGYGKRRLIENLRLAGIDEEDGAAAREHSDREAVAAALRFAERRRLGPFAAAPTEGARERDKAITAMVRAGHSLGIAKAICRLEPGAEADSDDLAQAAGLTLI